MFWQTFGCSQGVGGLPLEGVCLRREGLSAGGGLHRGVYGRGLYGGGLHRGGSAWRGRPPMQTPHPPRHMVNQRSVCILLEHVKFALTSTKTLTLCLWWRKHKCRLKPFFCVWGTFGTRQDTKCEQTFNVSLSVSLCNRTWFIFRFTTQYRLIYVPALGPRPLHLGLSHHGKGASCKRISILFVTLNQQIAAKTHLRD